MAPQPHEQVGIRTRRTRHPKLFNKFPLLLCSVPLLLLLSLLQPKQCESFQISTQKYSTATTTNRLAVRQHMVTSSSASSASSASSSSSAKNSNSNTNNKTEDSNSSDDYDNQRLLLEQLDQAFDYEGRVGTSTSTSTSTSSSSSTTTKIDYGQFRSGFVSVMGAPNMGKSTLVNALLEEELCIATRRPQTTRHAILGILTSPKSQVCLLDTPGILEHPAYKLQEHMMEAVHGALHDGDVYLIVTDVFSTPIPNDDLFQQILMQQDQKPIIVVINKVDLVDTVNVKINTNNASNRRNDKETNRDKEAATTTTTATPKTVTVEQAVARWRQLVPHAMAIVPTSAAQGPTNPGVVVLRKLLLGGPDLPAAIRALGRPIPGMFAVSDKRQQREPVLFITDQQAQESLLPLGPPLYPEDLFTDRSERFLASEMIRAALLESFQKELPYCCEVQVTSFKEQPPKPLPQQQPKQSSSSSSPTQQQRRQQLPLIKMEATIFVERQSQKAIVIGKQGDKIKEVGTLARKSLEDFFQSKVYLQLQVKVDKDWRKQDDKLKKFGY